MLFASLLNAYCVEVFGLTLPLAGQRLQVQVAQPLTSPSVPCWSVQGWWAVVWSRWETSSSKPGCSSSQWSLYPCHNLPTKEIGCLWVADSSVCLVPGFLNSAKHRTSNVTEWVHGAVALLRCQPGLRQQQTLPWKQRNIVLDQFNKWFMQSWKPDRPCSNYVLIPFLPTERKKVWNLIILKSLPTCWKMNSL